MAIPKRITLTIEERFWAKVVKSPDPDGCWEWVGSRVAQGYGLFDAANFESRRTHRISWQIHFGEIPNGLFVLHRCDNPSCVRPDHLWLGDHTDNMADRHIKGRTATGNQTGVRLHPESRPRGEEHPAAKLTWEQVREIRRRHTSGEPCAVIARDFGVGKTTARKVVRGMTWRE